MSAVARLLGVEHPIILGAMSRINNPELVAAVSEAGGFGLLVAKNCAGEPELRQAIAQVRGLTDKPFGVNLAAGDPACLAYAAVVAQEGVKAVTTSAGPPDRIVPACKAVGLAVLHVVANVRGAVRAQAAGVDAVIAEGGESGGLQGQGAVSTMVLIPAVCDAVVVPVVAAGGIADRRGYRAALALGAQGVQVGTRFIATSECVAEDLWKDALCQASEQDTELVGGGRVLARVVGQALATRLAGPEGANWPAGQCAGLVRRVLAARQIIEEMVS